MNSLLFAAYGVSKRLISPFPQLSLKEIAAAGALAGAANAVLASPGASRAIQLYWWLTQRARSGDVQGAHAGSVRHAGRQTAARCHGRDVARVGVPPGHHARLLGMTPYLLHVLVHSAKRGT